MHPHTELRHVSDSIGLGVFATCRIPRGTITFAVDPLDARVSRPQLRNLPDMLRHKVELYGYMEPGGAHVVSWDIAKFVNHCCDSNTISTGWGFEIALRDIAPGEEITDEYGLFNLPEPMRIACARCSDCRGTVRGDDVRIYAEIWDARIRAALDWFAQVDQPLIELIPVRVRREVEAWLAGRGRYRSVRELEFFDHRDRVTSLVAGAME